jgi:hypothetical protein
VFVSGLAAGIASKKENIWRSDMTKASSHSNHLRKQALGLTITSQISCDDLGQCVAAGDGCFANFVALKKVEPFLSMEKLL